MSETLTTDMRSRRETSFRSQRGRRALAIILVILFILLALAANLLFRMMGTPLRPQGSGDTGGVTWVRSIYGMSAAIEDQFDRPQAAVTAPDGTVWVTDGHHGTLMRFEADGRFISQLAGPADLPLEDPSRFAFGPDGLVYVCETLADTIRVLDQDMTEAGSFFIPQPVSVAVSEDRIVVGSVSGFAILDKEGNPLSIIGSRGKGDNEFDYVHGVAIGENGNIYVADSFNNRLSAYSADGTRLWMIRTGPAGNSAEFTDKLEAPEAPDAVLSGDDALQLPLGLTIDGAGRLVVADMFDCTLAVFDPADGAFIGKYGTAGADDGQFFYPVSVTYDAQYDWFAVADSLNHRVELVRIPGSAGGTAAVASVRRALAGPLRACVLPFILLVLALIVWLVARKRRSRTEQEDGVGDGGEPAISAESVANVAEAGASGDVTLNV